MAESITRRGDSSQKMTKLMTVYSGEILAKIKMNEPVRYEHVTVIGDLDITKLGIKFGEIFSTSSIIEITNSQIGGIINFANTEFNNDFDIGVNFSGTEFSDEVSFANAKFSNGANFMNVQFAKEANFKDAEFHLATFTEAKIHGYARFENAKFYGNAIFDGIQFNNYANFVKAKFEPVTSFYWANFNDYANFREARFEKFANFANTLFRIEVGFEDTVFNDRILLKGSMFTLIKVPWKSIKNHLEYNDEVYLKLVKSYNNQGLYRDADNCYYQYRLKRAVKLKGLDRLIDGISFITYGYGVRSKYPLIALLIILFVFCGIFLLERQTGFPEALRLSFVVLTTTTEVSSITGDSRWWCLLERLSGWLLMASFLVVLARQTIR